MESDSPTAIWQTISQHWQSIGIINPPGATDADTGCVFGGELTALCYPEGELVRVPAMREYFEPKRPLNEIA